jgi:hypothetical protein
MFVAKKNSDFLICFEFTVHGGACELGSHITSPIYVYGRKKRTNNTACLQQKGDIV